MHRSESKPPDAIVVAAQAVATAGQVSLVKHRTRKTTIQIDLLAMDSSAAKCFDSSMAQQLLGQRTLTRLCIGLATVRVRLDLQRPRRTLFRIHYLSKKTGATPSPVGIRCRTDLALV
ncbi:MAG: hypothetical protein IPM07_02035 [Anaerolineales bacterium]|nr:hypothetical protein [Anaerolineales bacterium]